MRGIFALIHICFLHSREWLHNPSVRRCNEQKFSRHNNVIYNIDWVRCTKRCLVHHSRIALACQGRWSEYSPQVKVKAGSISASRRSEKGWKSMSCAGQSHRTIPMRLFFLKRSAETYPLDVWYARPRARTQNVGICHLMRNTLWKSLLIFYCEESHPQSTKNVSAAAKVRS